MNSTAKHKAAIIGVGETKFQTRHQDKTYTELAQEAALLAMENARVTPDEIDAVVFSMAPTEFMGVNDAENGRLMPWAAPVSLLCAFIPEGPQEVLQLKLDTYT